MFGEKVGGDTKAILSCKRLIEGFVIASGEGAEAQVGGLGVSLPCDLPRNLGRAGQGMRMAGS